MRAELRLHLKAGARVVSPPAGETRPRVDVPLMNERAADRARPGVQILVAAPHGEIRIAVVKRQRRVADGMREIESGERADAMTRPVRCARDRRPARCGTESRPQHERNARAVLSQTLFDDRLGIRSSPARGVSSMRFAATFKPVPCNLRGHCMPIGRERARLDQDLACAPAGR